MGDESENSTRHERRSRSREKRPRHRKRRHRNTSGSPSMTSESSRYREAAVKHKKRKHRGRKRRRSQNSASSDSELQHRRFQAQRRGTISMEQQAIQETERTRKVTDASASGEVQRQGSSAELQREPSLKNIQPSTGVNGQATAPQPSTSASTPSLVLSVNDIAQIIQSVTRSNSQVKYDKNIIPTFNPSQKNQRIEGWIAKVNECAKIYGWTNEQTAHYALPKLDGHARKWYEGLQTILLTWTEWQDRLIKAFPSESNYGALLSEMLDRRMKFGESIDEYYYDKMLLINACSIAGKKAVDCLVYGIEDRTIRASASSARCSDPEDLLKFLKDLCREANNSRLAKRSVNATVSNSTPNDGKCFKCNKPGHRAAHCRSKGTNDVVCFNCKELGHPASKCLKPIIRCDNCQRIGHTTNDCYRPKDSGQTHTNYRSDKKTLLTKGSKSDSKYYKTAIINKDISVQCYVDFGSDCTLIRQDIVDKYDLPKEENDVPNIRGFGNGSSTPLGRTKLNLCVGEVTAEVNAYIIESSLLSEPLLVGQDFTERADVVVIKTHDKLEILKRTTDELLSNLRVGNNNKEKIVLRIKVDTVVDKLDYIGCVNEDKSRCDVLVEDGVRRVNNAEYCVLGGIYKVANGECQIAVCNLSDQPIFFRGNSVLVRGERVVTSDSSNADLSCRQINSGPLTPFAIDDVKINPNLTQEQQRVILNLINTYRDCFAQTLSELGCADITEMNIELNDTVPVVYRPYRLSHSERGKVREMVKELIDNDIAEESNSCYASPIILVRKKTGGYRLCVDFRALNRKTRKDHFPMPRIDDQLDMLNGNRYYTSLDLASGYYQIPINDACKHLTAFVTPDGLYQFKRMPFGLVNSPAVFQRTINQILGNSRFNSALAYMDDILIPGRNFDEELGRLENTFRLLRNAKLTLNIQKCNFFQEELEYLGYEISEHGIRPGKEKIDAVNKFPLPRNVHEVRQFVGLASYFRKFIQSFASIARPLTDLTRKGRAWCWDAEQQMAFEELKKKLTRRPVLGIYDPNHDTFLHTDASKQGLGGILLQRKSELDPLKPIAYFSRKSSLDEQNYHAYELETLAVVAALQRFRVYLLGIRFTIVTDCAALRATFSKRDLIPRVARWWMSMQEFDFDIQYRPGHAMSHVDALSRNPLPCESDVDDTGLAVFRISQEDWLLTLQMQDTESQRIRKILNDTDYSDVKKNYVLKNNKLFRKIGDDLKWVVPKMARFQLCKLNHDDIGHFSVEKTVDKISKDFWFPKMKRFIKKYVRSCLECAYSKEPAGPKEGLLHPIHKVERPFDTVHVDHLGPFIKSSNGNSYLLVLVDGFTKFCILTPLRNLKTSPTIRALESTFCTFGYPNRLISDQGSTFTSHEFKHFCDDSKIGHVLNAVASPRANGQVERYNRTVLNALTAYTDKLGERCWDKALGKLQWGLNNTLNKGIGKTPSEALFAIPMVSKGDNIFSAILKDTRCIGNFEEMRGEISKYISKDQQAQKERYDKTKIKAKVYKVDDLVKILKPTPNNDGKSKKLLPKYTGPFRITKILDNDRYEVSTIPGTNIAQKGYRNIWASDRIKPWISISNDDKNENDSSSSSESESNVSN